MIALSIATTWLTLTAAGFAGLSVLDRGGDGREDEEPATATPDPLRAASTCSDQSRVLADTRSLIARALSD
jgi:hypothetical protein